MRFSLYIGCLSLSLSLLAPLAVAQDLPPNVTVAPNVAQSMAGNDAFQQAVDQALRDRLLAAGDADAAAVGSDGQVVPLSGALEGEEEVRRIYRYDTKKNIFYGTHLPPRSFNNIPYPY